MIVRHFTDVTAEQIADGFRKRVVIGQNEGAPNFIMRVFDVEPGFSSPFHEHFWEHEIFVVSGEGYIRNGQEEDLPLGAGDTIFVPPYEKHCMVNKGSDIFRFVCLIPVGAEN
ncbi:MAG: cupin domain-containing protein [Deltaproteobacteria bacterium]|nr:cupin domain-containing protein [Deltaproteobacteria bacterium]